MLQESSIKCQNFEVQIKDEHYSFIKDNFKI